MTQKSSTETSSAQISNVMREDRLFPPPAAFAAKARIGSLAD